MRTDAWRPLCVGLSALKPDQFTLHGMRTHAYHPRVRFMVLGPVAVIHDGEELPLGGPKQRTVLAMLLAARGRVVSVDRLIEGVWGENEPASARNALQVYVHHLRGAVGDMLRTDPDGYALETNGELDAEQFEAQADRVRSALDSDPSAAGDAARTALALWTGRCYAGVRDAPGLTTEIAHLENLRLEVLLGRVDADLELGRHTGLIGELESLIEEFPLQDRFRGQLMLALYRSGRQVEALRLFERTRRFLADEMGLDPAPELSALERRILVHDPSLDAASTHDDVSAVRGYEVSEVVARRAGATLHRGYQRSIGREVLVTVLDAELADDTGFIANHVIHAKQVASVDHPHVHQVFDTWREPGRAFQIGRWLAGGSLAQRIADGPLPPATAAQVIGEIGGALAQAHRQGVPHGDVGSRTVWFDAAGHAYLSAFRVGIEDVEDAIASDATSFIALAHEILTGSPPLAISDTRSECDREALDPAVSDVFDRAFSVDGFARVDDFLRALRRALGVDVVPPAGRGEGRSDVRNPYKGLKAFQEGDAGDYHGRAELTERLEHALATNRLVAIVGPSGSGKSSVAKAGLVRAFRSSDRPILISEMYPGAHPFEELAGALVQVSVRPAKVMEELLGDDRGLIRVLKRVLPDDESELLLVIDQFEELFSLTRSSRTRELFLDNLVQAVNDPESRLRVALTLRADFFDRPLEHPEFGRIVEAGLVPVSAMTETELAQAISAPASAVGVEFEVGLVPHIVNEVNDQVGGLPLLQYALTEVFDRRTTNTITLADYQACGGIVGALASRAEQTYSTMHEHTRRALRHALLRMVAVGDGSDDLRVRVRRLDLRADGVSDAALTEALTLFGTHRLLTFDLDPITRGPTVEVAHEALLREWPRLSGWIDAQRDELVVRRRLAAAMTEWRDSEKDDSYLPTGGRLTQFEQWSATTSLELGPGEREFLDAATSYERRREDAVSRRRQRLFLTACATALVFAVIAAFALRQRSRAAEAAFQAETSRLAATAQNVSETLPELGLLVAAESHKREVTAETLGALQRTLVAADELSIALDVGFGSSGISADGRLLSTWDLATLSQGPLFDLSGEEPQRIDPPTDPIDQRHPQCAASPLGCPGVFSSWVDFDRGGGKTMVQFVDGVLHLYAGQDFARPLAEIRNSTVRFAASPDGSLFAHGTYCETVEEFDALTAFTCPSFGFRVVDVVTGETVFAQPEATFSRGFSWSADGSLLHRIDGDGGLAVWDTETWREVDFLGGDVAPLSAIEHIPQGNLVALTTDAGDVVLLDAETGTERITISGLISTGGTATAAFSSDGRLMLSALPEIVRLWDTTTGEQIGVPFRNEANAPRVQSGAVLRLVTETGDNIHVWDLDTSGWFDRACAAAGRNMTRAEWEQFGPRDVEHRATCPQWDLGG